MVTPNFRIDERPRPDVEESENPAVSSMKVSKYQAQNVFVQYCCNIAGEEQMNSRWSGACSEAKGKSEFSMGGLVKLFKRKGNGESLSDALRISVESGSRFILIGTAKLYEDVV